MERKELIHRYLEAETTAAEERLLAESFASLPPRDAEERAAAALLQALAPAPPAPLPEAGAEFDGIVRQAHRRTMRGWGLGLAAGAAAAAAALVLLPARPAAQEQPPASNSLQILEHLQMISEFNPADAERYDFKPVGDGFIMTAVYPDGSTASFILSPVDGGESYCLVSLND